MPVYDTSIQFYIALNLYLILKKIFKVVLQRIRAKSYIQNQSKSLIFYIFEVKVRPLNAFIRKYCNVKPHTTNVSWHLSGNTAILSH